MDDRTTPNPLLNTTSSSWDRLIGSVNPPAMLVAIRGMMSATLQSRMEAEDIWQETLLHAFRDRAGCEWRGLAAFRRWLIELARNRIRDLADAATAQKRGAGREVRFADREFASGSGADEHYAGPCATTTPSRVVTDREIASQLEQALGAVPAEWRDVVRLRVFEECTMEEIAARLG